MHWKGGIMHVTGYRLRWALALCVGVSALWTVGGAQAGEKKPMLRTIDASGFHTVNGEKFWSRPL